VIDSRLWFTRFHAAALSGNVVFGDHRQDELELRMIQTFMNGAVALQALNRLQVLGIRAFAVFAHFSFQISISTLKLEKKVSNLKLEQKVICFDILNFKS
jgi:hypothetical protein